MSGLAEHRAAIARALAAVPGMGHVHECERYAAGEAAFRALYLYETAPGQSEVRGWWLRRVATREHSPSTGRTVCAHTWQLRGYAAFADERGSERQLDERVESFRAAVRADPTLGGVCQPGPLAEGEDGVQVVDAGPVRFAGVLCHGIVLKLTTWSYL